MDTPILSVVIPVYHVEEYLVDCLDSILTETVRGVEVIAVDDCSPDGSGAILNAYAKRDRRLRIVRLSTNVGLGRARNAGMAHSRGKYIWFVDGDDWLPAGALPAVWLRTTGDGCRQARIPRVPSQVGLPRQAQPPVAERVNQPARDTIG